MKDLIRKIKKSRLTPVEKLILPILERMVFVNTSTMFDVYHDVESDTFILYYPRDSMVYADSDIRRKCSKKHLGDYVQELTDLIISHFDFKIIDVKYSYIDKSYMKNEIKNYEHKATD